MMNQYKKETAQIYAPMALIEKTKAAVREEERIQREQTPGIPLAEPAQQVTYEDYAAYHKRNSVRKWTYPLTAAAAVMILLSVSMAMRGIQPDNSEGHQSAADATMMSEETSSAEDEACAEIPEQMNGNAADSTAKEMNDSAATDSMAEAAAEEMEGTGGAMEEAAAADSDGEDLQHETAQGSGAKESVSEKEEFGDEAKAIKKFRGTENGSVKIEAVKEKPDFYNDPDAEDIVYEGVSFRVIKEEKGWAAYVETAAGKAYVIQAEIEDKETFVEQGYERLAETEKSH